MTGEVVFFYAFDVANEIVPGGIRTILGETPSPLGLRLDHAAPKDAAFHRPLTVQPATPVAHLGGKPIRLQAHIFSVGVVSILLRAAFADLDLPDLRKYHQPVLDDGRSLDELAQSLCTTICKDLKPALIHPSPQAEPEAYTAFCIAALPNVDDLTLWLSNRRAEVAGLLSDLPPERLSESQIAEVLRQTRSLLKCDLVVIDWDAALVVDLDGPPDDVLYVLEVANLQLEEFRIMDQTLDRALDHAYVDLERRTTTLFGASSRVLRKLRWLRVDLTRLADEVTHITKFVGDWYLARVYLGVRERFHLDRWRQSVDQRLSQLDELYSVARSEVYERRMIWLELIVVVFFAIDLIAIFWWRP